VSAIAALGIVFALGHRQGVKIAARVPTPFGGLHARALSASVPSAAPKYGGANVCVLLLDLR
jgi:hypothetical protein